MRKAVPSDRNAIAALHCRQIPWGLLSELGEPFVVRFYDTLLRSRVGFVFLAEHEDRLIGFASGVMNWRRMYREFLRRHFGAAFRVLAAGFRRRRWTRLAETTRYATSTALPGSELVAIALEAGARGTGAAEQLVRAVLDEFGRRGVEAVRVTTAETNAPAQRLYERVGFQLHSRQEIHPGTTAAVYVISVGDLARAGSQASRWTE